MKVLVIGNSQSAALKRAYEQRAENLRAKGFDCHFYVIPGGSGPDFLVEDDRLVPGNRTSTLRFGFEAFWTIRTSMK